MTAALLFALIVTVFAIVTYERSLALERRIRALEEHYGIRKSA